MCYLMEKNLIFRIYKYGVPQGSIPGQLLFILYIEILMKLRSNLQSENTSKIPEVSTTAVDTQINSSRSNSPRQSRPPTRRGRLVSSSIGPKGSTNNTSDLKIRSASNSPSRNTPLKGVKFDTPLLKDFLRRQVKETRSQTDSSIQTPSCDDFSDNTHL